MQIHACVLEIDPETGVYEIVDYAVVDDCGNRVNPQIVEGQVMGATAHALGAATWETFAYDEDGNLLTPNFYDYHVPHALDMPPLKTGAIESPSPFSALGTKGMGEGGGAGIHAVCAALQDALRTVGGAIIHDSHNPYHRVFSILRDPACDAGRREGRERVKVEGTKEFDALARARLGDHQRSRGHGGPDARRRGLRGRRRHATGGPRSRSRSASAGIKMTMDFEQLEERPLEFSSMRGKGKGMGAMMDMTTSFTLSGEGDHTHMAWEADVSLAGVLASMGQRVLQPIINQQVEGIMTALEKQLEGAA